MNERTYQIASHLLEELRQALWVLNLRPDYDSALDIAIAELKRVKAEKYGDKE